MRSAGIAATAFAVTALAGACGGSAATTPAQGTTTTDQLTALQGACPSTVRIAEVVARAGGRSPSCVDGAWVFRIPADATPARVRRTEAIWTTVGFTRRRFPSGSLVRYDVYFVGSLGAAAQSDRNWHVLWQLQGRTRRGWVAPPVSLAVRDGRLWVEGGHGHPLHNWVSRNYWWRRPVARYSDGRVYHVQLTVRVSANPRVASVSAVVNGAVRMQQYRPRSASGRYPGTMYSDQLPLESRSGLYRGTEAGAPPRATQTVSLRIVRAG